MCGSKRSLQHSCSEIISFILQYQGLESSLATKAADLKKTLSELNGKERAIKEIVRKFDEEKKELLQTVSIRHSSPIFVISLIKLQTYSPLLKVT